MKFKVYTLNNGVKIITAPSQGRQTVTILLLFRIGSRYEPNNLAGIAHFIEHMMYKGTKRRPTTLAIARELDGVGATYNAFTAKDHTGFYVQINRDKVELALDILSDIILHSKFDKEEIDREKKVILEEIKMYDDNPMFFIDEFLETVIYPHDPLGRLISGTAQTVKSITREQIIKMKEKFYKADNLVIAVAGGFLERKILGLVKKYFQTLTRSRKIINFVKTKQIFKKPSIGVKFKKTQQIQLALGFPGYPYNHPDLHALELLAVILGGNMSSRLFILIRERLGLAYYVKTDLNIYQDVGNIEIIVGLDQKNLPLAWQTIINELKKIKNEGVSKEELKRAQDFLRGKLALNLEDSENQAMWLGRQKLLTGKIETPQTRIKKINRVTKQDIHRVARTIFQQKKLSLAIIGPFRSKKPLQKLVNSIQF